MVRNSLLSLLAMLAGILLCACGKPSSPPPPAPASAPSATDTNVQTYAVKGVIQEYTPGTKVAKIRHEEIPGYMAAMTMNLEARSTNEFLGLKAGDVISFRMNVTEDDGWIDQVKKIGATPPTEAPSRATTRVSREVEPLNVGDMVPEYRFTNEFGKPINLSELKGKAVALTFIFTTCPYPTFCPRMSQNFNDALKKLQATPDAPTNWHMLSISFDPETDTPAILKGYAERYGYDSNRWSFVTGDIIDITAITEQFGLQFWRESGTINHNLRSAVIDAKGRVHKIFPGNEWKGEELAEAIIEAAR